MIHDNEPPDGLSRRPGVRRIAFQSADSGPGLRGVLHLPEKGSGPFPAAVVCHPHTLMGGNMDNQVVVGVCLELALHGWAALRFDFRGAGRSEGSFDGGGGELDDVRGAVEFVRAQAAIDPECLAMIGYSFGAGVALHYYASDHRLHSLVGIALVEEHYDDVFLDQDRRPKLFVVGEDDRWAPTEALRAYVRRLKPPKRLHIIRGAGHLFSAHAAEVAGVIAAWLTR